MNGLIMATPEGHIEVSRRLLIHADEFLESGDLPQASEKAWGAAMHYMEAVAKQRGWRNESHRDFFIIKNRLAEETDDPRRISELFAILREQHVNFYEISYPREEVELGIAAAKEFIDRLERARVLER